MAVVSDQTIAAAARSAGFPSDQIATAVAVALAESGGDATATNHNSNSTTDYGLWQINSIHKADLAGGNWQNPNDNARMAFAVWSRAGRHWTPWMAWLAGKHTKFLARGAAAAGSSDDSADAPSSTDPNVVDVGIVSGFQDVANVADRVLRTLSDKDLWIRFGIYLIGFVFLVIGVVGVIWSLGGSGSKSIVKKAVKLVV